MKKGEEERTSQAFQGALSDTLKDIKGENRKNPQVPCDKHPDTGQEDFPCLNLPSQAAPYSRSRTQPCVKYCPASAIVQQPGVKILPALST